MRFADFLRATVLLSAGSATTLALLTLVAATGDDDENLVVYAAGWWLAACVIGLFLGRRHEVNPPIARLLAEARAATAMPEVRPGSVLINRLWPLAVSVAVAGALGLVEPQVAGIATGFTLIWALAWRRQEYAVRAIEERDGVAFFVQRVSPVRPISLERLPGFRRERPTLEGEPVEPAA